MISDKDDYSIDLSDYVTNKSKYEVIIYTPIFSTIKNLYLEFPDNSYFNMDYSHEKSLLVLGGVHTFGIGCSSANLMFPNMLSRNLNLNLTKIAFNKSNYLSHIYDSLKELPAYKVYDLAILEIDYLTQDDKMVDEYLDKIMNILQKQCNYLICWFTLPKVKINKRKKILDKMERYHIFNNIYILDLSEINNQQEDICSFNGFYINDSGNMIIHKKLIETSRSITKWNI